jgi:hypothetical protein
MEQKGIPVGRRLIEKRAEKRELSTTPDQGFGFSHAAVCRVKTFQAASGR